MLAHSVIRKIKASVRSGPAARYIDRLLVSVPALYPLLRYESQLAPAQLDVLLRLLDTDLPGDIIECGVYRGGTTALMARHLLRRGVAGKTIHALDSFAGFRPDTVDVEIGSGLTEAAARKAFTGTSVDYLRRKLGGLGVAHLVHAVPGYFEDTLAAIPGPFSLALIDCDLEAPVLHCLTTLWDRMTPGAALVVDDYASAGYRGARLAGDRFLASRTDAEATVEAGFLVLRRRLAP